MALHYRAYPSVQGTPHMVVAGRPQAGTVLTIGTQPGQPLVATGDTSAEQTQRLAVAGKLPVVRYATSDRFSIDGLVALAFLTQPEQTLPRSDFLIALAEADAFGRFRGEDVAQWLAALRARAAELPDDPALRYPALLAFLPELQNRLGELRALWEPEFEEIMRCRNRLIDSLIRVREYPQADLVVYHTTQPEHPMTFLTETEYHRVCVVTAGHRYAVYDKYETYVQLSSHQPRRRVDLAPLAARLNELDAAPGLWQYDGLEHPRPCLRKVPAGGGYPDDHRPGYMGGESAPSALFVEDFLRLVVEYLIAAQTDPAVRKWDPAVGSV